MKKVTTNERVYLDWAAATPLAPEVISAMMPFLAEEYGNPSAIHQEGLVARTAIEKAREQVAASVQVRPEFVTFTGGGTESNNLSIVGTIESLVATGKKYEEMEIVTTSIEHPSVSKTLERLQKFGVKINFVEVDEFGEVELASLKSLLSEKTVLVSLAYANSEIGVIQPLRSIRKTIRAAEESFNSIIMFHVDAAQAPLWLNCQFDSTGADLLSLDTLKCCGPKGVGILIQSRRAQLVAVIGGGGQESGLRPGTENVPGIVGAGVALGLAQYGWKDRSEAVSEVRDAGIEILLKSIPGAILNGPIGKDRLANNINISITGLDTEYAAVYLDSKGFAVSTKSACAGAGGGESSVVLAISGDSSRATSTLRFTIGPDTTIKDFESLNKVLLDHLEMMKSVSSRI